jgi:hypothetical protein
MRRKLSVLLLGLMLGSVLFAMPKEQKVGNDGNVSVNGINIPIPEVLSAVVMFSFARPEEGSEAEYYDRMMEASLSGMPIEDRYDRLMKREETAHFPLARNVSEAFLSLLVLYLPDDNANSRTWRETIVDCMSGFQLGGTSVETIESKMFDFHDEAENGGIVFGHCSGCMLVFSLVLYELERLMGIVQ